MLQVHLVEGEWSGRMGRKRSPEGEERRRRNLAGQTLESLLCKTKEGDVNSISCERRETSALL